MDSGKHVFKIQQKRPLGGWEWAETAEMTWDEAIHRAAILLSPTIEGMGGEGEATSVRFRILSRAIWTYLPQWDD